MSQPSVAVQAATSLAEELAKPPPQSSPTTLKRLGFLDRFLALWIFLAMALGLIVGNFSLADEVLEKVKFVDVSLPLAIALMVMMWPILCRVSPSSLVPLLKQRALWKHLLFSVVLNWIIAPLFMFGLAWAFLPDKRELREGLILVGIARCIAMVLVWTEIARGDIEFCAINVVVNSLLQIVLYSPLAILYIRVFSGGVDDGFQVGYATVARSVAAFLGIPLAAALATRAVFVLIRARNFFQNKFLPTIAPLSLIALLFTIVIIFAAQGKQVVRSITDVLRIIPPLLVYFAGIFFATIFACRRAKVGYARSTSSALAGASNNFELAIAVAIASYGANSPQALAATVGPLVDKWDLPDEDADEEKHLSSSASSSHGEGPSKTIAGPEEAV
ncbi:hypothetical protein JCM1840_001345 [Sporobolomyces johnsonii]